jgi:hypothetical protein
MRDALALFGFYLKALPHETKGLAKRWGSTRTFVSS